MCLRIMRVPLSWLQEFVDLPESVEELSDLLTFSGLEVEGIETVGSEYENIRAAEIVSIRPHPDADKLTLCMVNFGEDEPLEVVCGAPNVRVGMKTIYAPVGSVLPTGLKLKKAKIRGIVSLGMLCAEDELGLSESHEGIMDLPEDTVPGTPAVQLLGAPEVVFDLEITPNRGDCLSVIGVARELSALTNRPLTLPALRETTPGSGKPFAVEVQDGAACPRYTAHALENISVGPSPDWMQQRLRLCGFRPINAVVDITNYVMLETGQPLHAFDRDLLRDDRIVVRRAKPEEAFTTLDDREHTLAETDLVIADGQGAVALAGVMGGANSEIRATTTRVLLESAAFDSAGVRATAKRLEAHTESSYRFARGCDISSVFNAGRRAAELLQELCGGTLAAAPTDLYPAPAEPLQLFCSWENITSLIGLDIPVEAMKNYFQRLELRVVSEHEGGCTVSVPGHRLDITRPVDLVEEIARLHGLDKIPVQTPQARIVHGAKDFALRVEKRIWSHLAHRGFQETLTYSLTSVEALDRLDPLRKDRRVHLPNPISRDQSVLRSSLLPQLVETLRFNRSRQAESLAVFEVGKVFETSAKGVVETPRVAMALMGPTKRAGLERQKPVGDLEAFLNLKGEFEVLFALLGCADKISFRPCTDPTFSPGQGADIVLGETPCGRIGLLNSSEREAGKFSGPIALGEVDLLPLFPKPGDITSMAPIPDQPAVTRDVALLVDRSCVHQQVLDLINQQRPGDLEEVTLFDVFTGEKLGTNRKSMAYRFTYRNAKKTLTDQAVEKMHRRIEDRLMQELPATIEGRGVSQKS